MTQYIYGTVTVPLGQKLSFVNELAFGIQQPAEGPALALEIAGAVEVTAGLDAPFGSLNGVLTVPGMQNNVLGVLIDATGSLRVISATSAMVSWGIQVPQRIALNITNHGLLEASSIANATAIAGYWGPSDILNTGTIRATSTGDEAGAVSFSGGGRFVNSGLIEADAKDTSFAVYIVQGAASFDNSGTIRVTDHTAALDSAAVYWSAPVSGSWRNSGTLQGDYALRVHPWANQAETPTFVNTGTMIGTVDMGDGATRLVNSHTIQGVVRLQGGDDIYDGRLGVVTGAVFGDDGNDTLIGGIAAETISGGAGDDLIDGGGGTDQLDGGAGLNTLSYATSVRGVVADLMAGTVAVGADVARAANFQRLAGGGFADTLVGAAGAESLSGGGGDDSLSGGAGDDSLDGGSSGSSGSGNDTLNGEAGNDTLIDADGNNFLQGGDGNDVIFGGSGFDRTNGNVGNDTVHGNGGDDWVIGGKDNDVLYGDAGNDILNGNLGNDTADGGEGNDTVRGGQGDDVLFGGDGNDVITGDLGNDTMSGGAGADVFRVFNGGGQDRITDFNAAEGDRVQLDPGTTYTVSQAGADVVIDLGAGQKAVLAGVTLTSLPAGWIFGA